LLAGASANGDIISHNSYIVCHTALPFSSQSLLRPKPREQNVTPNGSLNVKWWKNICDFGGFATKFFTTTTSLQIIKFCITKV